MHGCGVGVLDVLHDMDKVSFARVGILEAFEVRCISSIPLSQIYAIWVT
jgi:hypothetical protein